MKLTSIELHPSGSSEVVVMSFRDPRRQNPYNVKTIIGLDADEISSRFYGSGGGKKFFDMMLPPKDLVFRIELNPTVFIDETPSDLRDNMYKMISASRTGTIDVHFKNGDVVVAIISGFMKRFEAVLFSKVPEIQVTLDCEDPMLRSPNPTIIDTTGLDPTLTVINDNVSTAQHGFKFELEFLASSPIFTIKDETDDWSFVIEPTSDFNVGDVLHFSSEYQSKYLYLVPSGGGSQTHLADKLHLSSIWPILFPGENQIICLGDGVPLDLQWNSLQYHSVYWGV